MNVAQMRMLIRMFGILAEIKLGMKIYETKWAHWWTNYGSETQMI